MYFICSMLRCSLQYYMLGEIIVYNIYAYFTVLLIPWLFVFWLSWSYSELFISLMGMSFNCTGVLLLYLIVKNTNSTQLIFYRFSWSMELVKWTTCFKYLFINSLFLIGQLSSFEMCTISFPLSLFSSLQSYNKWSTVWWPLVQGHSGDYNLESM